jgi:hypothetical protein
MYIGIIANISVMGICFKSNHRDRPYGSQKFFF